VLDKAGVLRQHLPPGSRVSIDGGIGPETIGRAAEAGVQIFVTGSAVFDQPDYGAALRNLSELARPGKR